MPSAGTWLSEIKFDGYRVMTRIDKGEAKMITPKRVDSPYTSRRTKAWLKLQCKQRQELVVCGYTDRTNGAAQV